MAESKQDESSDTSVEQSELDKLNLKIWEKLEDATATEISEDEFNVLISNVFSADFEIRSQALSRLSRLGQRAAQPLVDILVKNPTDSTKAFQVTYALEEIGKSAIPPLIEALKKIEDFKQPADITLFGNITETLIRLNDKSAVPILIQRLDFIKQNLKTEQDSNQITQKAKPGTTNEASDKNDHARKNMELYQAVRLRIHALLGEMGVKDALNDLLLLLGDGTKRVHEDIIETLSKIGDRRALVPLLRLYNIEQNISDLGSRFIKLTFREIVRRDKASKNDSIFKKLTKEEKDNLHSMFPRQRATT